MRFEFDDVELAGGPEEGYGLGVDSLLLILGMEMARSGVVSAETFGQVPENNYSNGYDGNDICYVNFREEEGVTLPEIIERLRNMPCRGVVIFDHTELANAKIQRFIDARLRDKPLDCIAGKTLTTICVDYQQ